MSKKPEIKHEYHAKKDKLEISIHGYALKSKSSRDAIMLKVLKAVEKSPSRLIADAKVGKTKKARGLPKENRLAEVGD
jgi:hypothetical protein